MRNLFLGKKEGQMNEPLIALGSQKNHLSFSLFVSQVET
jgi:hypothetical protein